ncbi:lipopolysaccharide biosynthesis protein [Methylosinus trichosporium]|uniref:lipopolysaccharide biosynthesis protein n=1 Tax=Methylosinus trichosporium TaxID=426 RepID=UPI001FCC79E1|nr:oligosaccharide flippase family protein [Methylosinus trichosporium]
MVIAFVSIPLTIRYLGPERYGAWVMLGSLLAWLNMTDFGLSNGLTNALTSAVSEKRFDLARTHVSNGVLLLCLTSLAFGLLGVFLWPYFDWSALFGVTSPGARAEVGTAAAVLLVIVFAQSPLSVTVKIYNAFQEGRLANYWAMLASVLGLVALLVVTQSQGGLPLLICSVYGSGLLVSLASACWLFAIHKPKLAPSWRSVDLHKMRAITDVGLQFFALRAMALVTFQSDYFFIGHFLGASHVPQYSVSYSLFSYVSLPQTIASAYLWTAYNEAITLGDIAWVKKTLRANLFLGLSFAAIAAALLACIAKPFIVWWAGTNVEPSTTLIGWMAAWCLIYAYANSFACLFAAASHLRTQVIYASVATCSNLLLSWQWVQHWGVEGVTASTVVSYLVFICVPVYFDCRSLFAKLDRRTVPSPARETK